MSGYENKHDAARHAVLAELEELGIDPESVDVNAIDAASVTSFAYEDEDGETKLAYEVSMSQEDFIAIVEANRR